MAKWICKDCGKVEESYGEAAYKRCPDCDLENLHDIVKKDAVVKLHCSDGLDAHALKRQLDRLLCVVNAVTCPHRHGQPIRPKDLTRLVDRQIEVEEALREMGT